MKPAARSILFVCTGNTCRSPMAEAIARSLVAARAAGNNGVVMGSAGVAAADGLAASTGAIEAMDLRGIDLSPHRSRMLSRQMIDEAAVIFTMTPAHADAVLALAPDAAHKVEPIDPRGAVLDPVGQSIMVYMSTAEQLEELIAKRLVEMTT